ncbi:tetratricopeptide repeat protein [Nonomuraea sp. NPDC049152]|uniref:tetratricopeptide repeat protein n=1 Tax=Nonomuraea sp. NPDC049152 TaxID=3154350 RepID=UPI0034118A1A
MSAGDMLARANRLAAMNLYEKAGELYEQAVREHVPGAIVKYGEMLFEAGDYPAAEKVLRSAVDEGDDAAYGWLSDVLVAAERPSEAAHLMERAAGQGVPKAALRAATIWADAVGDRERAESWYKKAIDRGEPGAVNDYGVFLAEDENRLDEAERLLRVAAEEGDDLAYGNLGSIALDRGDPEAAIELLRQGITPGSSALLHLAVAEEQLGRFAAARAYFDRAVSEDIPDALVKRAQFLADQDEAEAAEADFLAAADRGEAGADYYYAAFLARYGRADEATDRFQRAIEAGSDAAYEDLALIHQSNGDTATAEKYFMASITAGWLSAVFSYADMLRGQGRLSEVAALVPLAENLGADPEEIAALRE